MNLYVSARVICWHCIMGTGIWPTSVSRASSIIFLVSLLSTFTTFLETLRDLGVQISDVFRDCLPVFRRNQLVLHDCNGVPKGAVHPAVNSPASSLISDVGFKQPLNVFPFVGVCNRVQRQVLLERLSKVLIGRFTLLQYGRSVGDWPLRRPSTIQ